MEYLLPKSGKDKDSMKVVAMSQCIPTDKDD